MGKNRLLAEAMEQERNGKPKGGPASLPPNLPPKSPPPLRLDPYQPFPIDTLPVPMATYAQQGAEALGCDPAYVGLPCLAVAAAAIGNSRVIRLKRGWTEPSIIWAAIIGDSGTLKSPAYLQAVGHMFHVQARLLENHRRRMISYQCELAEFKAAQKQAKAGAAPDPGDAPEAPTLRRIVCSDVTIEKLAEVLADNPRGVLVARDELAGWLGSYTRYKGKGGGTDLPHWLEMFRAGTLVIDRKTAERRTLYIARAAASITGGIQPGVLARALSAEFLEAGLAARLLFAMPPRLPKRWSEVEIHPDVQRAWEGLIERLLELDMDRTDSEPAPYPLQLSPAGKTAWVQHYDEWAQEQATAEGELAAALSKLEAYTARLALLHHVVRHVGKGEHDLRPVEKESIDAGATLCRWFSGEARRLYSMLAETEAERNTRRLVEYVQGRGGGITVRELMRSNNRRYPTAVIAEAALAELVDFGLARWNSAYQSVELIVGTHNTHDA
jgi:hypothetical protein